MQNYLVIATKPWNERAFTRHALPGSWFYGDELAEGQASFFPEPRYIFFLHWSKYVSKAIIDKYECIGFHLADLPNGRGGSPLQNQITRGVRSTMLTAFRLTSELDAGPIYDKRSISLNGTAQEIYERAAELTWAMIADIITYEPQPTPQKGEVVIFKRRKPEQSELPKDGTLEQMYDHIRMLDAETYPPAFIDWGKWRLEFFNADGPSLGAVTAEVTIKPKP